MRTEATKTLTSRLPTVALALICAACAGGEQADDTQMQEAEPQPAATEAAEPALPDTTAEAVWAYMQEVDYREDWALWPDMGELYEGGEPHGMLLTTYLNSSAHSAVTSMASEMPAEAFIVKENFMPDSTLAAVTIMYKVEGYDPEHGDWFWAKYAPDGTLDPAGAAGRVASCQECHMDGNDYVLTGDFGAAGGG